MQNDQCSRPIVPSPPDKGEQGDYFLNRSNRQREKIKTISGDLSPLSSSTSSMFGPAFDLRVFPPHHSHPLLHCTCRAVLAKNRGSSKSREKSREHLTIEYNGRGIDSSLEIVR